MQLCNNYGYKYRGGLHYSKRGRIKSIKLLVILFFTDPSLVGEIIAGMSIFDAINHAMSTMASGGFSTKNNSLAHWNHLPWVHYIIIIFMFLAGSNFVLSYFAFKGKLKKVFKDSEFKTYFTLIIIFSLIFF